MIWTANGKTFWMLVIGVFLLLVYLLSPILTPFLLAGFFAYIGDPLVDRLERVKLSRTASVMTVFVGIFLIILLFFLFLVPILETQLKKFVDTIPLYIEWANTVLAPYLTERWGVDPSVLEVERLKNVLSGHWKETGGFIRNALQTVSKSGAFIVEWLANLALIPLLTFYLLRDWDRIVAYVDDLLPRSSQPVIAQLAQESDEVLGSFLKGQLLVMLALTILYATGLWLIGVEFALLIGLIAGLVSFVPYLGFAVGVGVAGIAILFQTQDPLQLLWVVAVFGVAQMLEGMVLTPLLVGEKIGLHPVTVIFAIMAGGQLFGFFGVLVALPVAAVIAVIMRHVRTTYKQSQVYQLGIDPTVTVAQKDIA